MLSRHYHVLVTGPNKEKRSQLLSYIRTRGLTSGCSGNLNISLTFFSQDDVNDVKNIPKEEISAIIFSYGFNSIEANEELVRGVTAARRGYDANIPTYIVGTRPHENLVPYLVQLSRLPSIPFRIQQKELGGPDYMYDLKTLLFSDMPRDVSEFKEAQLTQKANSEQQIQLLKRIDLIKNRILLSGNKQAEMMAAIEDIIERI